MHVLVLGSGLAGVTSAWYLREAGFDVSVLDRQPGPGLETSFANGGQISVSHPEPWANPGAPRTVLRWIGREDAPLLIRPRAELALWRWAGAFARECLPHRTRRNTLAIAALARHSRQCLRALRERTGIRYFHLERGILHLLRSEAEMGDGRQRAESLSTFGIRCEMLDRRACEALEPALAADAHRIRGGLYAMDDESGDAHAFVNGLVALARDAGVEFHFGATVRAIELDSGKVRGARFVDARQCDQRMHADAVVMCLGSYSTALMPDGAEKLPIYPVKGYSVTVPVSDPARAPVVSLTEETRRIVCSRLGEHLRVAGTAELAGFDLSPNPSRSGTLLSWLEQHFPGAADTTQGEHWCGLRPATPSNVPLIGRSRVPGLWLNTGHGTLGWTLCCGSAESLARMLRGESPIADFPFLG